MRFGGVLLVRRSVADVGVQNNQRGTSLRLLEGIESLFDAIQVVGVADPQHIPTIGQEARHDVFSERDARAPLDRDVVVVVDPAEVVETKVAGQRSRFRSHALHQAAVTANYINVIIEDFEVWSIEMTGEPLLCDGHANTRCDALSQGPCSRLYARRPMVLGVAGRLAVELAEAADVVKRNRWPPQRFIVGVHGPCTAEMKRRPE